LYLYRVIYFYGAKITFFRYTCKKITEKDYLINIFYTFNTLFSVKRYFYSVIFRIFAAYLLT